MTLTPQSLAQVMWNSNGVDYAGLLPAVSKCLQDCGCTTVERAAMWHGQVGEESAGLYYMQEQDWNHNNFADYEWRKDLGNVYAGDGARFHGRGPIQVTGRHNYTALSQWAFERGLVPSATFFVDDPDRLASDQYGFIGVTWFWTTRNLNAPADSGDVVTATHLINGGENGLWGPGGRNDRWRRALSMGADILPGPAYLPLIAGIEGLPA